MLLLPLSQSVNQSISRSIIPFVLGIHWVCVLTVVRFHRFCIPFTLATCLGLSALALDLPITVTEANEGLVPPATAFFRLGKGGGILMTVMLLM